VPILEAAVLRSVSPWDLIGLELHMLEAAGAGLSGPFLAVYDCPGRLVSLGRYHLYSGESEREGVGAIRRLSGGRAVGGGEGWIGIAMILPRTGVLLAPTDSGLKPDQVMNRYARGLLAAMRSLGVDCFYPGRDAITVNRREIAMCAFERDASGALLFEASLAVNRGMQELAGELDLLDPSGAVPSVVHDSGTCTTLVKELGREISFDEIARVIVDGYAAMAGGVRERELSRDELGHAARCASELRAIHWLRRSAEAGRYNRIGRMAGQLGQIEVRLGVSDGNRIEWVMLSGDFLANSDGIAEFETALEGQRHDLPSVSNAVNRVFGDGRNFILGAGDLSNLAMMIVNAQ
jgi:lipoate-protein ligase A